MKFYLLLSWCLLSFTGVFSQTVKIIVAADGSGNYITVQQAVNAVSDDNPYTTVIYIKKGLYKEKLTVGIHKLNVKFIGEDVNNTILTYDDYHAKKDSAGKETGTSGSASIHIYGDGFSAENITFQNTAGMVGQAVAVWVAGDKAFFKHCRFLGFQDTLYTYGRQSRQLYVDCYIEGTVDFIFGSSTAWFQNCRIYCKRAGYVTAASTPDSTRYGYVFNHCTITGDAATQTFYLGRPWRPHAKVVYLYCNLGPQIKPEGWNDWDDIKNQTTAYFAEYHNAGPGFTPAQRVDWAHQLTDVEARQYTMANVLKGWDLKW